MNYNDKKIAFVLGHTKDNKGAFSDYLGDQEFDFWHDIYDVFLKDIGDLFEHNPDIKSYTKRQKAMAERTKDYDLVLELHFDAATPKAHGCHAIYYFDNKKAKELAEVFSTSMERIMGIKARHNVPCYNSSIRGGGFIMEQKPTALLLESFFGTNQRDVGLFEMHMQEFVTVIKLLIKSLD